MSTTEVTGTIVPLVTPFHADESIDTSGVARLIDYVLQEGADALMPTALTGEGLLLTADETILVWDAVFERAGGLLPIIPAVISTTTRAVIHLVKEAERRGSAAIMVAPVLPELYAGRAEDEVCAFYSEVAATTQLPLILFNHPPLTGVDLVPLLVMRLAEIENVRYIKESTGDSRRVHAISRLVGERVRVICGAPNVAMESLALGCTAWITGIMNVVPRSARQLMRAVHDEHDFALARCIYFDQILPTVDLLSRNCNPTGTIKAGVCARGAAVGVPRRPGRGINASDQGVLEDIIERIARAEDAVERGFAQRPTGGKLAAVTAPSRVSS